MQGLGVYIHIPYCLQRCTYCDFATYVQSEILPANEYVDLVKKEIFLKKHFFEKAFSGKNLSTIYFGGGTPSLIPAELIISLIKELAKHGFTTGPETEITIEINPATIDEKKLNLYLESGVNRFSVGAQTFHDRLLKAVHREHNAQQTFETLALLKKYNLNFSFDLLFALPTQTVDELKSDVAQAVELGSSHISPYCLTVPEGHPLSKNRPLEDEQLEMFEIIDKSLLKNNFTQYEISNYAKPSRESQHNLLYWTDRPYWGLGLSAHSYSKNSTWGERFWNASNIKVYEADIQSSLSSHKKDHFEILNRAQSLTDFCHTSLRLNTGLQWQDVERKFDSNTLHEIKQLAKPLLDRNILIESGHSFILSPEGRMISNQVFEKFLFTE